MRKGGKKEIRNITTKERESIPMCRFAKKSGDKPSLIATDGLAAKLAKTPHTIRVDRVEKSHRSTVHHHCVKRLRSRLIMT